MSILDRIIKENVIIQLVSKTDFEKAQNEMLYDEFKKYYKEESDNFYKLIYADEKEIPTLLLNNINKSISTIKGWIIFFGIVTILSIIGEIIFYINFMKLIDLLH